MFLASAKASSKLINLNSSHLHLSTSTTKVKRYLQGQHLSINGQFIKIKSSIYKSIQSKYLYCHLQIPNLFF